MYRIEGAEGGGLLGAGDEEGVGEALCARLFAADGEEVGATCGEAEAVEEAPRLGAEDLQPSMAAAALPLLDALPCEVVDDPATEGCGVLRQPAAQSSRTAFVRLRATFVPDLPCWGAWAAAGAGGRRYWAAQGSRSLLRLARGATAPTPKGR